MDDCLRTDCIVCVYALKVFGQNLRFFRALFNNSFRQYQLLCILFFSRGRGRGLRKSQKEQLLAALCGALHLRKKRYLTMLRHI